MNKPVTSTSVAMNGADDVAGSKPRRRKRNGSSDPITVPSAMSIFPKEIFTPSRRWAEERFTDIRHWNELDHGGHFAAFEQPEVFVDEVRTAFRTMR